ncbi:MAG TPA: hypothetical protein VNZ23_00440 [Xanthobacteraceae bacterium]|jgi:hypothetical protein|nr:hypothetical protein [Xanthobacteraceae bacterium]
MTAYEDELKNVLDDSLWKQRDRWLYISKFEGPRIGVALATNNKPQFSNFALNCGAMERLRKGKSAGTVEQIFVVAVKMNSAGQPEYRGKKEAEALYEKLRHQTPLAGQYGPFWTLAPYEFDDDDDDAPL